MKRVEELRLDNSEEAHQLAQLSDTCLALERDQQADSADNSTTLRVLKQRYSGETGIACHLKYDLEHLLIY